MKAPETCDNCACFAHMLADGTVLARDSQTAEAQGVCRRSPPGGRWVRVEVPLFDLKTGAPVTARNGQQRSEAKQVLQIGYPPAVETGVCFDGWRPMGTRPGASAHLREVLPLIVELASGNMVAAKRLGKAMLDNLMEEFPPAGGRAS